MRWVKLLVGLLALLAVAAILPVRRVADNDMSPNLQRGDLVWVLPLAAKRGDVVVLADPLDPQRTVLRRVLTGPETKVTWDDVGARVNGKRQRHTDMGALDGDRLFKEVIWSKPPARAFDFLVRLRKPAAAWTSDRVEIPEGHVYLLADDRDRAMDSRWWGPVPETDIQGVVRARLGEPDPWRGWFSWLEGWE